MFWIGVIGFTCADWDIHVGFAGALKALVGMDLLCGW